MGSFSALSHLECSGCASEFDASELHGLCPSCGRPLLARYDLTRVATTPEQVAARPPTLWRYHELLPVRSAEAVVSLGEGMTPLLPLRRLGEQLGLNRLLLKDESPLPTGSFKARGAAVGVSKAAELGARSLAMPTNGNAGAAWSAYAARAGVGMVVAMPISAPPITRLEVAVTGADLRLVDGLISDAGRLLADENAVNSRWFDVATLKEPYRIEGKKTMGFEIAEQLGWRMPDVVIYPTGGGVGLIGIHKALSELRRLGWLDGPLPRLVSVQSTGCAPVVAAFAAGERETVPWPDAKTVAFGLTVPKPLGDTLMLDAIYETGGTAVAVDDSQIVEDLELTARLEGTFLCPEGAATVSAARRLLAEGWLEPDDEVVLLNTGAGVLYGDVLTQMSSAIRAAAREAPAVSTGL